MAAWPPLSLRNVSTDAEARLPLSSISNPTLWPRLVAPTRETMRRGFADAAEQATERELVEQEWTRKTTDFREGIKAWGERRLPNFEGR